jgi:hypothetical protein
MAARKSDDGKRQQERKESRKGSGLENSYYEPYPHETRVSPSRTRALTSRRLSETRLVLGPFSLSEPSIVVRTLDNGVILCAGR